MLHKTPYIIAVASGKGGVGKSFISSNLAMALAKQGKRTVLIDLDLGSANMHTCLGFNSTSHTLSSLFEQDNCDINSLVEYNGNPYVGLISGAADELFMANLKHFQKLKIMRNLPMVDADFVILDLGAGTAFNTLDFFLHADEAILAVTPEPTSVENCYRFTKSLLARKLNYLPENTRKVMHHTLSHGRTREGKALTFSAFLNAISDKFPDHGKAIQSKLDQLKLNLIVNQVLDPTDIKLGTSISILFDKFFNIKLNILGHLMHDTQVIQALKQRRIYYNTGHHSDNIHFLDQMAIKLISKKTNARSRESYEPES